MRDWNKDGKIDGRDYYIYKEFIEKTENKSKNQEPTRNNSNPRYFTPANSSEGPSEEKVVGGCVGIYVFVMLALIFLGKMVRG